MNIQTLTPTRQKAPHEPTTHLTTDLSPLKVSPLKKGAAALVDGLKTQTSKDTPSQPLCFRQIAFFLLWVIAAITTDTAFAILQSLKCTLLLLCELPKPWIDSLRALAPLWLTAFSIVPLIAAACASKVAAEVAERAQRFGARLSPVWTTLRASLVFQRLASLCPCAVVPSSADLSAQSDTTPCPWASNKTNSPLKVNRTPQKVSWGDLQCPDRSLLD